MRHVLVTAAIALAPLAAHADSVDDTVRLEMQRRKIPGLSIAIIDGGKVVRAVGYGVVEAGGTAPVTATTLFQAGSISKAVAALGTLHLVEQGVLALDADVNTKLVGWRLPDSPLTRTTKVTIRRILSHTAGLTVHGFPGYAVGDTQPTIEQILDGQPPANTPAIRVDIAPDVTGAEWKVADHGGTAPRLGPLVHTLAPHKDPDAKRTAKVLAALRALGEGQPAALDTITPGFKHDIGNGYPPIAGITSLAYIDGWPLATKIERHDGKVDRIAIYRREPAKRFAYVIVYFTAEGLVTDFDIVGD